MHNKISLNSLIAADCLLGGLLIVISAYSYSMNFDEYNENYKFHQYFYEDGLPSNSVSHILQDDVGFLWFFTNKGVARYDGVRFKVFSHTVGDVKSLPDNWVEIGVKLENGDLWFGTARGLSRIDTAHSTFENYSLPHLQTQPTALLQISEKQLLVGTPVGLFEFNLISHVFRKISPPVSSEKITNVNTLVNDGDRLWVATAQGLFQLNPLNLEWIGDAHDVLGAEVTGLLHDSKGGLWVGTEEGALFYIYQNNIERISIDNSDGIWTIEEDEIGKVWVGTWGNGIIIIGNDREVEINLRAINNSLDTLPNNYVNSIRKDRNNVLWIATLEGVVKLVPAIKKLFHGDRLRYPAMKDDWVWSSYLDDSRRLWLATSKGVSRLNNSINESDAAVPDFEVGGVWDIAKSNEGGIWIGGDSKLVYWHSDTDYLVASTSKEDNYYLPPGNVYALLPDEKGNKVWIGNSFCELILFSLESGVIHKQSIVEVEKEDAHYISALAVDTNGHVWVAGTFGLVKIDTETEEKIWVGKGLISNSGVNDLVVDDEGRIWVASAGSGIHVFSHNAMHLFDISPEEGIEDNEIVSIEKGGQGIIWAAGIRSMYRISPSTGEVNDVSDLFSYRNLEFHENAMNSISDKYLAVGTNQGVFVFSNDIDSKNKKQALLTGVNVLSQSLHHGEPTHKIKELVFNYDDRLIQFEMSTLDSRITSSAGKLSWILEGFDKQWMTSDKNAVASYTVIPSGHYLFKVKSANAYGVWGEQETVISITVEPPLWKSVYAYFFYSIILMAILVIYIVYRYKNHLRVNYKINHDYLTGLLNREGVRKAFGTRITAEKAAALFFIDLDGFKQVNDTYGHAAGDEILIQVALRLKASVRSDDLVARLAGDEFLVILHDVKDPAIVEESAERILKSVSEPVVWQGEPCNVGASIGVAYYPDDASDIDGLMKAADSAMYQVKSEGKGSWKKARQSR